MKETKAGLQERVENLQIFERGNMVHVKTTDFEATFYKRHFAALERHFMDVYQDYKLHAQGNTPPRTNRGKHGELFRLTMDRVHESWKKSKTSFLRWLAVAEITWLSYYLDGNSEPVDCVIDYFFDIDDDELREEKSQRAKQIVAWQLCAVKNFSDKIKS